MRAVQLKYGQLEKQRDVLNHWIQSVSLGMVLSVTQLNKFISKTEPSNLQLDDMLTFCLGTISLSVPGFPPLPEYPLAPRHGTRCSRSCTSSRVEDRVDRSVVAISPVERFSCLPIQEGQIKGSFQLPQKVILRNVVMLVKYLLVGSHMASRQSEQRIQIDVVPQ